MPKLAGRIRVSSTPTSKVVQVDGKEFPWHTAGVDVHVQRGHAPAVTITIPAEHVTVDDALT
jgi:hypothetical protein